MNIDLRCMCGLCESRTQETYTMAYRCTNCGDDGDATIRKGDRPVRYGTKCPNCGCSDLVFYPPKHREVVR